MRILRRIPKRPLDLPRVVAAIGIFDGVHRGHQAILKKAVSRARALKGTPVGVTFDPHPLAVLNPSLVPTPLLSLGQRLDRFSELGIRLALVIPFTPAFSRWSPRLFVDRVLVRGLRVREVVVGHDFGFGKERAGSVRSLRLLGAQAGFKTRVVPPVRIGGERISSRRVREFIREGDLRRAERFLGRPVTVSGQVVRGAGRGKGLGFPTANLKVLAGVLPAEGVYGVRVQAQGRWYGGMANLGWRPTFQRANGPTGQRPLLEVHLFGRHRPLYGSRLEIQFLRWLRSERRFHSPEALVRQLKRDAAGARRILYLHHHRPVVCS